MSKLTAYWYDKMGGLQEFNGDEAMILDGALVFCIAERWEFIVAPGDWHDVTFEYPETS